MSDSVSARPRPYWPARSPESEKQGGGRLTVVSRYLKLTPTLGQMDTIHRHRVAAVVGHLAWL